MFRGADLTRIYALATEFDDAHMDGAILDRMIYDQSTTWLFGRPACAAEAIGRAVV